MCVANRSGRLPTDVEVAGVREKWDCEVGASCKLILFLFLSSCVAVAQSARALRFVEVCTEPATLPALRP